MSTTAAEVERVHREHRARMLAVLLRAVGDVELAEDVLQDAGISLAVPPGHRLSERLAGVLAAVYLIGAVRGSRSGAGVVRTARHVADRPARHIDGRDRPAAGTAASTVSNSSCACVYSSHAPRTNGWRPTRHVTSWSV